MVENSLIIQDYVLSVRLTMPRQYEAMRDAFKKQGLSDKAAETKAAKIWNSKHKGKSAVGRGRD